MDVHSIALFLPNWVGDVVMATPAVRAIRAHFPTARLIGFLRPYVTGVIEGSPWFDELIPFDPRGPRSQRTWAVARQLRRARVDLALLFPNSFRASAAAWLGGCRRRVGYARYGRSFLLTDALTPLCDARGRLIPSPVVDAYNRLARQVGADPSRRMELFTTPRDEAAADVIWARTGMARFTEVVCLNPGAAFGSAKCWPVGYFAHLARDLSERRDSGVLVLCGPAEREVAREIVAQAGRPGVAALADSALSIGLTKACVRRCDLLVTTDSGPRHFAAAFNKPVVTLFGPTHIAWTETYHPAAVHLQKPVECGPCQLRVCPIDHRCMKLLTPAEVFAAVCSLLARFPPAAAQGVRHAG